MNGEPATNNVELGHYRQRPSIRQQHTVNDTLAGEAEIRYAGDMVFLLRHIARYAAKKIASDPVAREQAARAARGVAKEVKQIALDEDPAKAAGRAMRRAMKKLQGG
jgi:hypothetical protein